MHVMLKFNTFNIDKSLLCRECLEKDADHKHDTCEGEFIKQNCIISSFCIIVEINKNYTINTVLFLLHLFIERHRWGVPKHALGSFCQFYVRAHVSFSVDKPLYVCLTETWVFSVCSLVE